MGMPGDANAGLLRLDLSDKGTMCALVDAMCYMENGERIPMEDIEAGWELM